MHRVNAWTWLRPYWNGLLKLSLQLFWGVLRQQWWSRFEDKRVSYIDLLPQKQSFCKMVTIHTKALHSYSTHLFQHWKIRTKSTIFCTCLIASQVHLLARISYTNNPNFPSICFDTCLVVQKLQKYNQCLLTDAWTNFMHKDPNI